MLVLSRDIGEEVQIFTQPGNPNEGVVTVTVGDIRQGRCRLGVDAPKEMTIHRTEVVDAILARGGDPSVVGS